jgi:electron transfer flavoprotein alpha subunit
MAEILVLAEHRQGEIRDITFEMLHSANRLGKENELAVTALFLGNKTTDLAKSLDGACDRILCMDAPEFDNFNADPYLEALGHVIRTRRPILTMIGHTSTGMDLAPAAATRLALPLATDCLDVRLKDGRLHVERQVYGGKLNEGLTMKSAVGYLITLRPGSFVPEMDLNKSGTLEKVPAPPFAELRGRRFLGYLDPELEDLDIAAADILVSVGRGIGKPENMTAAQGFADAIGATLSCSRPVADKGWLPKSRQVGTSGKTVRPKVYIALGISGAFQHQAGMKNSGTIIAVNKDPKAPVFKIAHYGIVGDMFQALPVLTEKFAKG